MNVIIGQIRWDSGANKDAGCVKKKKKIAKARLRKVRVEGLFVLRPVSTLISSRSSISGLSTKILTSTLNDIIYYRGCKMFLLPRSPLQ
jgi:hypothetical protein